MSALLTKGEECSSVPIPTIGTLLREWRLSRQRSQLDLALDAGISTRHLSCVETGKAQPGARMIEKIAKALDVPLREHNRLLLAAGYAPRFAELSLDAPELEWARQAILLILDHHEPCPAFVTDRYWNILLTNRAMDRLLNTIRPNERPHPNILHQVFDPREMRPFLKNWDEVAAELLRHLHEELRLTPRDPRLLELLSEAFAFGGIAETVDHRSFNEAPSPIMTSRFLGPDGELAFFSTLTRFAATREITLTEIRIECLFPADEQTTRWCGNDP